MFRRNRFIHGFTLIELMVVLAIVAVITLIAAPNFSNTILRNRIDSQLRDLAQHINLARSETVSKNTAVSLCRSDDQSTCSSSLANGDWSDGWIVFADIDGDSVVDTEDTILKVHEGIERGELQVSDDNAVTPAPLNALVFTRIAVNSRATFKFCDESADDTTARALILERTGRVMRSIDDNADGIFEDVRQTNLAC